VPTGLPGGAADADVVAFEVNGLAVSATGVPLILVVHPAAKAPADTTLAITSHHRRMPGAYDGRRRCRDESRGSCCSAFRRLSAVKRRAARAATSSA